MKRTLLFNRLCATLASVLMLCGSVFAQQLPDPSFEDWSGEVFNGAIQPKHWHFSNVKQMGIEFTLSHQETGRTGGYSMMVKCTEVGALGITEAAPGYISLGTPWQHLPGITEINKATAGTKGGISWTYRPDSIQVWIKRTGNNVMSEDFHILYYSWSGIAQGTSYMGKNGSCTSYDATNEESDIRQALDKNACHTTQYANQISEGWLRARAEYNDWTCVTIPIYYFNDATPEMCNVIFSASNYPNFRANSGLYVGNSLYVDDVKMIYSSKIQKLYIGNKPWEGFDPNSSEEQLYSLDKNATIPDIYAMRGAGTLTNAHGGSATFIGRKLSGNEINIQKGEIDGEPTLITVTAEDGSSTTTYKIRFVSKPSDNARLTSILVNGQPLTGYNKMINQYEVALPYGTIDAPVISVVQAEDKQTVEIIQATSPTGTATIHVTAPDGKTQMTYTLNFGLAKLADNTLKGILIDGEPLTNFNPLITNYRVELPLGTTVVPDIEAISAYPQGEQSIDYIAPEVIDGGTYQIKVTTPGNPTAKVYKLNFKITASTNNSLKNLAWGHYINFTPNTTTYYVNLPIGTDIKDLPAVTYEKGDEWQTVEVSEVVADGTISIIVTSASGDVKTYRIVVTLTKSDVNWLQGISIGGVPLEGFAPDKYTYNYQLPIGTTKLPDITYTQGDEYQKVEVRTGGLDGTTRITVTAQDGTTSLYQINFSVLKANDASLKMIYVDGKELVGFDKNTLEYTINLPQGTTIVPTISWEQADEWQTITYRAATSLAGEAKITVRPQEGAPQTYIIRFAVATSSNADLAMIYQDGTPLLNFHVDTLNYTITLPAGVSTIPTVTFDKAEAVQKVVSLLDDATYMIRVTAENGNSKTYTVKFIIQKSENAFLKMIYLDGKPLEGFDATKLTGYEIELTGDKCPAITVDKEAGQQVSIMTPAGAGEARITVTPETGAANTYVITFIKPVSINVKLANILIDNEPLASFDTDVYTYELTYTDKLPTISYEKAIEEQNVVVLTDKNEIKLVVQDGTLRNTYTLHFTQVLSDDVALAAILLDGIALEDFAAEVLGYTITIPEGGTIPAVTYVKGNAKQVVTAGALSETRYELHVEAESGARVTYVITFVKKQYNNATLQDLLIDGVTIPEFAADKFDYELPIELNVALPTLTYVKRDGQNILMAQTSATQQQVIVVAEDGTQNTYTVTYKPTLSSDSHLQNILIGNTYVPLAEFEPFTNQYTYPLAWRTKEVPVITPIASIAGQTITINYSGINGTTTIDVVAPDGEHTATYEIAFPVAKSSNTKLESVMMESVDDFEFNEETNDYVLTLPAGVTEVPMLIYEAQEPEQTVDYVAAALNDTTKLIVYAENGDVRTYNFFFQPTISEEPNRLKIMVNGQYIEIPEPMALDDENLNVMVDMPYGTTKFDVECETLFAEQTYFLQPGGILRPTIITVKSNREGEKDVVYTITPNIEQQNPAHLTAISVNGTPLADFDPNRYSYIVMLDEYKATTPTVTFDTPNENVTALPSTQNTKQYAVRVTSGAYTNDYTLYFYYPNDVIPNGEFTEWTTAKYNNAPKPTYWSVLADSFDNHKAGLGTYTFGPEVEQDGDVVYLKTRVGGSAISGTGGYVPGFITLGTIGGSKGDAGSSSYRAEGAIPFHNTPDIMSVRYKLPVFKTNNRIVYELNGVAVEYKDASESSDFVVRNIDLSKANVSGVIPSSMNIILNSYFQEAATTMTKGGKADMYIDWVRFVYNSRLASISIDEQSITPADNAFTYTLTNAEQIGIPAINIVGEVSDQARQITWSEETPEGDFGVRTAAIRNFAEDGTYTDYTLTVNRPLSTVNTLADIMLDEVSIDGFDADTIAYAYSLAFTAKQPSVSVKAGSKLQDIQMVFANDTMTITVTPELGEARIYTIAFPRIKSSDTTLAALTATGVTYEAETHDYTIVADKMPEIAFVKAHPYQHVALTHTDNVATLDVTAEDGQKGTYTITLQPQPVVTSGLLTNLIVNELDIQGFNKNTFEYEATTEQPDTTAFVREYPTDRVEQRITADSIIWTVYGTDTTHTYKLIYPKTLSNVTDVQLITLDNDSLPDFSPILSEYTITTDNIFDLQIERADNGQSLDVNYEDNQFTIAVTAEDSTLRTKPYIIKVEPLLSNQSALGMIYLDGKPLANFQADSLRYTVMLPTENPKKKEPQMPSITYMLGQEAQTVELETASLGETTYLTVTSEDGNEVRDYELTILAEPSHNAQLTNILFNGTQLRGFTTERMWYSVQNEDTYVDLQYSAEDAFQTVEEIRGEEGEYILKVTAQDGTTVNQYVIDVWEQTSSNNAYVQTIMLDGKDFKEYDPKANSFSPKQLWYNINIPSTVAQLPDVYVALQEDGQTWEMRKGTNVDTIRVTAPNGTTVNDYVLNYIRVKSSNTDLRMIYVDGEELAGFTPEQTVYTIELPVGTTTLPEIDIIKGETIQEYSQAKLDNTIFYTVTAEDGTQKIYTLNFHIHLSDADTLNMLYEDGIPMATFEPEQFYYAISLPVGTQRVPEMSFDQADQWQTVALNTIVDNLQTTYQVAVTAQSGKKNVYTIVYTILQSTVDTLQMIYLDNQELDGFDAQQTDYVVQLPYGQETIPTITWLEGDKYQQVLSDTRDNTTKLTVIAENGAQRTYSITFNVALSDNTNLSMIQVAGADVANFDSEVLNYNIALPYGTTAVPAITFTKEEEAQNVTITVTDWVASINVTAANGTTTRTYTLKFTVNRSDNSLLQNIRIDGLSLATFNPQITDYDVTLPCHTTELPEVTWQTADEQQVVEQAFYPATEFQPATVVLTVVSGNQEQTTEYTVRFRIELSDVNTLADLALEGTTLADFDPMVNEYYITFEPHTPPTDLYTADDITFVLTDSTATATITAQDTYTLIVIVTAQNGLSNAYVIHQEILLPDNALLADLQINGTTIDGFSSEEFEYEYLLLEGGIMPIITATAQDTLAEVSITVGNVGDTTYVYCTAQDGTEYVYTVYVHYTDLKTVAPATSQDVILKHIKGTNQYFAATTRQGVQIAFYNLQGQLVQYHQVPICDPNSVNVTIDANGNELLADVDTSATGTIITIDIHEPLIYLFLQNDAKYVASGKIVLIK